MPEAPDQFTMFFITIYRILKTSVFSLWRNRWLSLVATFIMILTLFSISFFISLLVITNQTNNALQNKVDIAVFFNDSTSKDQIFAIQNNLLSRADVKTVDYISKEDALARWKEGITDPTIRDLVSDADNPLPRSLEVRTQRLEDISNVYNYLNSSDLKPMIKEISYEKNKTIIDRMLKLTRFANYAGWAVSAVFILISILVIYNTIMLTIFARREEIEIMRLVGASDWYVRGPFFIEGLIYGIIAAIASSVLFYFFISLIKQGVSNYLELGTSAVLGNSILNSTWFVFATELLAGLFLGALCSTLAIKKHLNEK